MKKVKIGNHILTKVNLDVDKFRNGDLILHAQSKQEWKEACYNKQPAWCYYVNKLKKHKKYGKLYNGYAIMDTRGLAPKGWHIPSRREWSEIFWLLGNVDISKKLKKSKGWMSSLNNTNGNGNNESGLSVLPGGFRFGNGLFSGFGSCAAFWSCSFSKDERNWFFLISNKKETVRKDFFSKGHGLSVRCMRNDFIYELYDSLSAENRDKWLDFKTFK
jgi:uncharacterized protein (TIGR02145 family)